MTIVYSCMISVVLPFAVLMLVQQYTVLAISRGDYAVDLKTSFDIDDETYAGFMPLKIDDNNEGNFFFWLAKSRNIDENRDKKVVIWLNGGPFCSSMVGMMWENGPFTLHDNDNDTLNDKLKTNISTFSLKKNMYAWNEVANVLFVEQPVKSGFSTAAVDGMMIKNEQDVAKEFHNFLKSFVKIFTEYSSADFYISGESYAGFYIPYIAEHIIKEQLTVDPTVNTYINLKGVAIGNGAIDDYIQSSSYTEYAYTHGLIPLGAKLFIDDMYSRCVESVSSHVGTTDAMECNTMGAVLDAAGKPNEYNTATFNGYDHIIKPDGPFHRFFNNEQIQELLHVRGRNLPGIKDGNSYYQPQQWEVCNDNDDISAALRGNHPITAVPQLQFLVQHINVLLYSGEFDLNCNTLGTLHVLEAHSWSNRRWNSAARSLWRFNGDVAGEYMWLDKLSFMILRNSGHLLPMDIPSTALAMIGNFINNISFADVMLPSECVYLDKLYNEAESSADTDDDKKRFETIDSSSSSMGVASMLLLSLILMLVLAGIVRYNSKNKYSSLHRDYNVIINSNKSVELPVNINSEHSSNRYQVF